MPQERLCESWTDILIFFNIKEDALGTIRAHRMSHTGGIMNIKMELIWLADKLDRAGMTAEANTIDLIIKTAQEAGKANIAEVIHEAQRSFPGAKTPANEAGGARKPLAEGQ